MFKLKSGDKIYPLGFFINCPTITVPYDDEQELSEEEKQILADMGHTYEITPRISSLQTVLTDLGIQVTSEILTDVTNAVLYGKLPSPKIVELEGEISQFAGMDIQ